MCWTAPEFPESPGRLSRLTELGLRQITFSGGFQEMAGWMMPRAAAQSWQAGPGGRKTRNFT